MFRGSLLPPPRWICVFEIISLRNPEGGLESTLGAPRPNFERTERTAVEPSSLITLLGFRDRDRGCGRAARGLRRSGCLALAFTLFRHRLGSEEGGLGGLFRWCCAGHISLGLPRIAAPRDWKQAALRPKALFLHSPDHHGSNWDGNLAHGCTCRNLEVTRRM